MAAFRRRNGQGRLNYGATSTFDWQRALENLGTVIPDHLWPRLGTCGPQGSLDHQIQSGNIAGGCSSPSAIDWSINEIKKSVRPTTAQRDALDDVRRSFDDAERDLETHCPTTIPASALSRLDTIQARLDSTWRATLSIQVALANFETELNDAQKIRFDAMDFAARASAQPVQRDAGSGTNPQSP